MSRLEQLWICVVEFARQNAQETVAYIKTEGFRGVFGFVWLSSCRKMSTRQQRELLDFTLTLLNTHSTRAYLDWKMQLTWSAFSPSCQPSCFNHIVMSTKYYHQGIGKCNSSGIREFRLEKTLGIQGSLNPWFIYVHLFIR